MRQQHQRNRVFRMGVLLSLFGMAACLLLGHGSAGENPVAAANPTDSAGITAIWANEGGDKVTRDELRARLKTRPTTNSVWDGRRIALFGARNEVVNFNLVLEAADRGARAVSVRLERLSGPDHAVLRSRPDKASIFQWKEREIELFLVRYLRVEGLSLSSYETYDERHVPERLRLPKSFLGSYYGTWNDRPDHDKEYPEIAVPQELSMTFSIAKQHNQSVWIDIYIPKNSPPGRYSGVVVVSEKGFSDRAVPVQLEVRRFTLPDVPSSKTMIATSYEDIARRYTGVRYPNAGSAADDVLRAVIERQALLAHRHKVSLIGGNDGAGVWERDEPRPHWIPRLTGSLFTAARGYEGPGENTGNNVYSIGTYGSWQAKSAPPSKEAMWALTDRWETWFQKNQPEVERFFYLSDESDDYAQTQQWARWLKENPGVGRRLRSFATVPLTRAQEYIPSLDIAASTMALGDTARWQAAADRARASGRKLFFMYNGKRPASGSFAIEDDGVALRELAWGQYKKGIARWFAWEGTYYKDYQGGRGETDVFNDAQTFGGARHLDRRLGKVGWNSGNGDGVLLYPGTDTIYPRSSYGLVGPIASLRLKYWRRGIQDVDYLTLARRSDPRAVDAVVARVVPKVLWENGVSNPADPTWVLCPISWSTNPDDWEAARAELADIIERGQSRSSRQMSDIPRGE